MKFLHALLLLACLSAAAGQMLLKAGATGRTQFLEFVNWQVAFGLGGYALSTLLWLYCLSKLPLRVVYPYTALTFVLVVMGAIVVFGERAGWRAGVGTILVLGGLVMIMADRS
jgi:multidrug transporter EmrE-like cation transporter